MRLLRLPLGATCLLLCSTALAGAGAPMAARPNILWLTSEDNGPQLGCYGDPLATTPNIDELAARGLIYDHCWSNAPVCAPARTTIISGMYPPSTGAEHMRSRTRLPAGFHMFPHYLRAAGYYCTNNSKEDYNLDKPSQVWDESSQEAHWRNRAEGQPFFAVFNSTVTHESQIRKRPHQALHDPARVRLPAYHPDHPAVRQDWAQYYDQVTAMDAFVGQHLRELTEAGLADTTIVFYYGDHGSGMPRSKRWPYNSGLHVPLVVSIPIQFRHLAAPDYQPGRRTSRLVSFVDLAPTVLSLAGIQPPSQFQGAAFLGPYAADPPPYLFGFRGRMDERYDLVRTVRDQRYIYVRNYMPHVIYGQFIKYMFETPTTRIWKQLYDQGELTPPQTYFWEGKPCEELYDLQADPDEVHNLAESADHRQILLQLRNALHSQTLKIRDVGFLPEAEIHARGDKTSPYEMGHDSAQYPLERILTAAEAASRPENDSPDHLLSLLQDADSAVRYWGVMGLLMRRSDAVTQSRQQLTASLSDDALSVRVIAAQALGQYGDQADVEQAVAVLMDAANIEKHGVYISILALNALDALDQRARIFREEIARLPRRSTETDPRMEGYVPNLIEKILADLDP